MAASLEPGLQEPGVVRGAIDLEIPGGLEYNASPVDERARGDGAESATGRRRKSCLSCPPSARPVTVRFCGVEKPIKVELFPVTPPSLRVLIVELTSRVTSVAAAGVNGHIAVVIREQTCAPVAGDRPSRQARPSNCRGCWERGSAIRPKPHPVTASKSQRRQTHYCRRPGRSPFVSDESLRPDGLSPSNFLLAAKLVVANRTANRATSSDARFTVLPRSGSWRNPYRSCLERSTRRRQQRPGQRYCSLGKSAARSWQPSSLHVLVQPFLRQGFNIGEGRNTNWPCRLGSLGRCS